MKNFKTTLLAAMAVLFLISCSSDDDGPSGPAANTFGAGVGQVSVDGTQYSFDKGLILNYGENQGDGTFNFDIDLYSGNVTLDPVNGPTGTGNYLSLELNSTQATSLKNATYTYSEDDYSDLSLSYAVLDVNLNFTNGNSTDTFFAESGTVAVSKSGNNYTVTINLALSNGDDMIGMYRGTLGPVDARE